MFEEIEAAISLLKDGTESQKAFAARLQANLEPNVFDITEILSILHEMRNNLILPEEATLSLILNVASDYSRESARSLIGEKEDFEDLCESRQNELVEKIISIIDFYLKLHPMPICTVQDALNLAGERFEHSLSSPEYSELFRQAKRRMFLDILRKTHFSDLANQLDVEPNIFLEKKQLGEKILTGKTRAMRKWEEQNPGLWH